MYEASAATCSVVELVDFEIFLTTKNLTLSDTLQEAWYNSEEGFKKVWVVFSMIGLPQQGSDINHIGYVIGIYEVIYQCME